MTVGRGEAVTGPIIANPAQLQVMNVATAVLSEDDRVVALSQTATSAEHER